MAFPYISEYNVEQGDKGHFDSESDSTGRLDFAHYSTLARTPGLAMPWRGAYAMCVNLATSTTDAYLQEDTSWDTAADGTIYFRFMLWISPDLVMANNDQFYVLKLQSTGPVDEVVAGLIYTTAAGLKFGVGETAITSSLPIQKGKWNCIEVTANIDAGGGNDGTIDYWVNGNAGTQVASLDQAAIIQGRFGVMGQDAGTTAGNLLFDSLIVDDARIYGPTSEGEGRFVESTFLTASGHVFVGHGVLENVTLATGFTDNTLEIYDTDTGYTSDITKRRVYLTTSTTGEVVDPAGMPIVLTRGCYVKLSGTTGATGPFATLKIGKAVGWGSDGAIRNYGNKRRQLIGNV